ICRGTVVRAPLFNASAKRQSSLRRWSMLANGARIEPRVALAAPQLELAAFPSHLARMLAHCLEADFDDVDQRTYVKKHALPKLIKHRRDLLQGSRYGWLDRSAAYRADVLE